MKSLSMIFVLMMVVGCGRSAAPELTIDVNPKGELSVNHNVMSKEQLTHYLRTQYINYGNRPVVICGASETPHKYIRTAMDLLATRGYGNLIYADPSGRTAIHTRYASDWEPDPQDIHLVIAISTNGYNTTSLSNVTATTKIAIICTMDSQHADLVAVLKQCEEKNVSIIYVGSN